VLADRARAMAARNGLRPGPGGKDSIMPPSPDGRVLPDGRTDLRPDQRPDQPNKPDKPQQVEFDGSNFEQAKQAAIAGKRPLVIKFSSERDRSGARMDQESWPAVKDKLADNAIVVNVQGQSELARKFNVRGYGPTTLIVDPSSERAIDRRNGFMSADQLSQFLDRGFERFKPSDR